MHINILCGQNAENLDFERGGKHSNHSLISVTTGHCTRPALGTYIG
jgi:hypothetical protein